jgi:hypothetical protein
VHGAKQITIENNEKRVQVFRLLAIFNWGKTFLRLMEIDGGSQSVGRIRSYVTKFVTVWNDVNVVNLSFTRLFKENLARMLPWELTLGRCAVKAFGIKSQNHQQSRDFLINE